MGLGTSLLLRASLAGAIAASLIVAPDVRSEPSLDAAVAGSRLVPLYLLAEDGSRALAGWFDTLRSERCAFATAGDGILRCLPIDDVLPSEVFADASCKEPLVLVPKCAEPRSYALLIEAPVCATSPRRHLHSLGKRFTLPAGYQRVGGSCLRSALSEESMYASLGPEIAPASFVAARYVAGRASLGIKTEY